jgi:hypothetical protein
MAIKILVDVPGEIPNTRRNRLLGNLAYRVRLFDLGWLRFGLDRHGCPFWEHRAFFQDDDAT